MHDHSAPSAAARHAVHTALAVDRTPFWCPGRRPAKRNDDMKTGMGVKPVRRGEKLAVLLPALETGCDAADEV